MSASFRTALLLALLLGRPAKALAGTCALCRQALASGGNQGLIQGFYWSILLIAGVPLAIMATIGLIAWRHHRERTLARYAGRLPGALQSTPRP